MHGRAGDINQTNLLRASGVAVATAALFVLPYALIVKQLNTNFSYLSIGVGLATGYAATRIGKASGIAIGIVAALATFAASLLADCLAIKWIVSSKYGVDVPLSLARHAVRPMSYFIFAIGAFVAFGAAGGRHELQNRSAEAGAGRFTPNTPYTPMGPTTPMTPMAPVPTTGPPAPYLPTYSPPSAPAQQLPAESAPHSYFPAAHPDAPPAGAVEDPRPL